LVKAWLICLIHPIYDTYIMAIGMNALNSKISNLILLFLNVPTYIVFFLYWISYLNIISLIYLVLRLIIVSLNKVHVSITLISFSWSAATSTSISIPFPCLIHIIIEKLLSITGFLLIKISISLLWFIVFRLMMKKLAPLNLFLVVNLWNCFFNLPILQKLLKKCSLCFL
jgi:hypothetical protein